MLILNAKSEALQNTKTPKHQKTLLSPPLLRWKKPFQQSKRGKILPGKQFSHKCQFEVFVRAGYSNHQRMRRLLVFCSDMVKRVESPIVRLDCVFRHSHVIKIGNTVAISSQVLKGFRKGGGVSHIKKRVD